MSYDIVIFDENNKLQKELRISLEDHHKLAVLIKQSRVDLLKRIEDYYSDCEFLPSETEKLKQELCGLLQIKTIDLDSEKIVNKFIDMCLTAQQQEKGISGIAD